jgi:hypothetical protein
MRNFRESPKSEVRRILNPGRWVNKTLGVAKNRRDRELEGRLFDRDLEIL